MGLLTILKKVSKKLMVFVLVVVVVVVVVVLVLVLVLVLGPTWPPPLPMFLGSEWNRNRPFW